MRLRKLALTRHRYVGVFLGLLLLLIVVTGRLNAQNTQGISAISIQAAPTQLRWTTVKPLPIGRVEGLGTAVAGKLYVFGGFIDTSYNATKRADVYDPTTDTWARLPNMPKGLTHTGITAYGKDIYFAGGYQAKTPGASTYGGQIFAIKDVFKYNVDTKKYTYLPSLPVARGSGELAVLDQKLHFFGGADSNRVEKGDHWVMPIGGTSWTRAASLPNPRTHMGDAVLNGKLYVIGGQRGNDSKLVAQTDVHVWNPATGKWTAAKSLTVPRSHISSSTFVLNGRIILAGGEFKHAGSLDDVTEYDPVSNTWREITPLPFRRLSSVARNINGQIFCTSGSPNFQTTTYKGVPVISN